MRGIDTEHHIARSIQAHPARSIHLQRDAARIGSRRDVEIEFKPPVVAVEDGVDAGIDAAVFDRGKIGQVGVPLLRIVANEIVGLRRQFIAPSNDDSRVAAQELYADGAGSFLEAVALQHGECGRRRGAVSRRATVREAKGRLSIMRNSEWLGACARNFTRGSAWPALASNDIGSAAYICKVRVRVACDNDGGMVVAVRRS